jgi:pimeloyl-ACP methyl ester carboxylesterase
LQRKKGSIMGEVSVVYPKLDQQAVVSCLFHPRREGDTPLPEGAIDHEIVVDGDVVLGSRFFLADPVDPHILFFHGNGEIVGDYSPVGPAYVAHGLSLLAVDYRGYGKSGGTPSATTMMGDAHIVFRDVQRWLKETGRTGPLIVMGRSLGSASAIELAASYEDAVKGLIIESGFAGTVPLLNRLGVDTSALGITEADGFKNVEKINQFCKATLILHGRHDQIIPVSEAEKLQVECAAKSKSFHIIPGADHNTVMMCAGKNYFEAIKEFADKIQGIRHYRFFRNKPGRRKRQ